MPKIKHVSRKEPERPKLAVKELECSHCGHQFTKGYNFCRHLAIIHGVNERGEPTSAADHERYKETARKEERKRAPKEPSEPQASTSGISSAEHTRRARSDSESPSSYPEPAQGPERPPLPGLVAMARQRAARRSKSTSEPTPAVVRKKTQPAAPSCRSVRAAVSAPTPLTQTSLSPPSKRRVALTPSALAKKVAHRPTKASCEVADELASTYAMSPEERRTTENLIRAMRMANREFSSQL